MWRKGFAGLIGVGLVAALISAAPPDAETPKSPKVDMADFTGKILAASGREPLKGAFLEGAQVKRLGDRAFLVGRQATFHDESFPETTCWFPVEDVLAITVYHSLEDARKGYQAYHDRNWPRAKKAE